MKKLKKRPETKSTARKLQPDGGTVSSSVSARAANVSFPVVGIGASAGGLEAFTELLAELPPDSGMAFILVQHLDPTHDSLLAEALGRATTMRVRQATDGASIKPNHVYVIPPNTEMAVLNGHLTLLPRRNEGGRALHLPVDFFLRSLAEERGNHAIGVILSGTGSDGTEGLRAIKGEDGFTFAQSPESARFDGMPRSAVDAGVVDYSLPLPALARELVRLSRHPYVAARVLAPKGDSSLLNKIFAIVRNGVGVDFSEYKSPTFERRLARRMALHRIEALKDYLKVLQENPGEVRLLYEDILIHVTSFFRDPQVFENLQTFALPAILKHKAAGEAIRVWVAGCSTGEEVYSLAISLFELLGDIPKHPIQIFGSDISEKAILKARHGVFTDAAMKDVSDERRRRFFTRTEAGYRINKMVRDTCVFVRHDLARDPPFSKLDLVSCRNVLIYFDPLLQRRVLPTFHYSLRPGGFLLLGRTESITGFAKLFAPLDKAKGVFARSASASALRFIPRAEVHPAASQPASRVDPAYPRRSVDLAKQLDRLLLARYSPPGVLINERMEILQFSGETGTYLRPPPGEPQNNLVKMARTGLVVALRSAVASAKKQLGPVTVKGVEVDQSGSTRLCDLVVIPFTGVPESTEPLFAVLFEEAAAVAKKATPKSPAPRAKAADGSTLLKLKLKLAATEEYLQSLIDDQDKTNDDLNAANEELTSSNEELQSMNEELETAKEELQSTNEELITVNDELHSRNQETAEINSDLLNLLSTVDVPILILDAKRRIRRFNPKARSILNILPSDIGRPLEDIKSNLQLADLGERIAEVIENNVLQEREVQDLTGIWYRMQIRPYKNIDNKIDGATISLVDIDALKHHITEATEARREAERANRSKDEFLATLSHELRTPLSSMLMQAQLLSRGNLDASKVKRAGEAIERGTRMQVKLIDDLLDVSRIIAGKLHIEFKPVDLRAVIRAALESVQAPAEAKSVTFSIVLDDSVGNVVGDPTRLQQVVTNLLGNAVKFSSDKGRVTVELDVSSGHARLRITDTGSGIEPEFLPHVFSRFAQEDGSTVRRHGGLGLGLAIARHLVEAHGGTIHAKSEGKGKGATFTVLLQIMKPGDADFEEAAAAAAARSADQSKDSADLSSRREVLTDLRVLVVDDDAGTLDAVAYLLTETGAQVRTASSANEAMTAIEEFRPEVLVFDIGLPGEDGYSLLRRVRALDAARGGGNVPALALTAFAGEENRTKALLAGFQMHLVKPIDLEHLTHAIAELSHRTSAATPV